MYSQRLFHLRSRVVGAEFGRPVDGHQTWASRPPAALPEVTTHWHDPRNRIDLVRLHVDGQWTSDQRPRWDPAGNLIFDGRFVYQYDAWNRLVQVNRGIEDTTPDPLPEDWSGIIIGVLVKHYTYDAVGRLVRTQSPYPDPETSGGVLRSERFHYDGIRRIQEVFIDPVIATSLAEGDPELSALAAAMLGAEQYEIDGATAPLSFESAQAGIPDPGPGPGPGNPVVNSWLDREYVWGPGDRGVDELLIQFDAARAAMPVLQDAGGDCVALADFGGSGGSARLVAQYTYDPYGQVISHEHLVASHAFLRAGHKGLFVDRLDAGVLTGGNETPRLVEGADLLVQNRNRTLKPDLGRYMQMDPNASGLVLITSAEYMGRAWDAEVARFDLGTIHADGSNLYQYLRSNGSMNNDPMGLLSWDPFRDAEKAFAALALVDVHGMVLSILKSVVEQYASNQEYDVEWATDWSLADDWHSRANNDWIPMAMGAGLVEHFTMPGGQAPRLTAMGAGVPGLSQAAKGAAMTVKTLRQIRDQAIYASRLPHLSGRYSQGGHALTKHPDFAGVKPGPHTKDGSAAVRQRFGGVPGVNRAGEAIVKRIVKQGIPQQLDGGRVKFVHSSGKSVIWTPPHGKYNQGKVDMWTEGWVRR